MFTKFLRKITLLQRKSLNGHCVGGSPSPYGHCY